MNKHLFAVYLGGRYGDTFIEDHEIIFVVASDRDEAKKLAKAKSKIKIDIHCDASSRFGMSMAIGSISQEDERKVLSMITHIIHYKNSLTSIFLPIYY